MAMTETLTWHDAEAEKPDSDLTVICWSTLDDFCFTAYWDGEAWRDCATGGRAMGITHWAIPNGPEEAEGA